MAQLKELQDEYRKYDDFLNWYKTAEDYERDYRSAMKSSREDGKDEKEREIVQNMMKNGLDEETIEKYTGISLEKVKSYSM